MPQAGQVTRVPGSEGPLDIDFPLGPIAPGGPSGPAGTAGPNSIGGLADGPDAHGLPPGGAEALAAALAEIVDADAAAMRPNQVFLSRQMVWQPPDVSAMAASWQVMVRTYGEQRAAWLEQASGQHLPASLFMADPTPGGREGRPGAPLVTEMEPWRFAVYAWGAERLVLKVVVKDDEEYDRNRRKRSRVALRLELMLPGVGRVVIQMEPASGNGVVMEVGAAQTASMQHMRDILPQVAAVVSRAGLTILRCRLRRELPASGGEHAHPTRLHTAALTQALFKAMAEVAVLLSQPVIADDLFSQSA
ncbi:hypothetical protein [Duganella guangzhouensis]|uniref:hypothetical protein n=1 Tax=Duganella guangzhouensis TaxID=2666084 RepID=UPI001E35CEAB|nr:hypothetical protein [Duganella guangzhouensis]